MNNVVDSCGWLQYFDDAQTGAIYLPALDAPTTLIVPTICLFEVHRVMTRLRGFDAANEYVFRMRQATVIALDVGIATYASSVATRYHLAAADAIIYATAQAHNATLWTQDAHFKNLPNVRYFEKPVAQSGS